MNPSNECMVIDSFKKALGSYGSTCYLFLSGRQDFRRQEIDEDYDDDDDDSTDFKMWQGALPHKKSIMVYVDGAKIKYLKFFRR